MLLIPPLAGPPIERDTGLTVSREIGLYLPRLHAGGV